MGDSGFPVALQWDLGPEKLRQMKNKLLLYFGSRKKSDGGECVMEDTECTKGHVLILFTQETVRDQVLRKRGHVLKLPNGEEFKLDVRLPEIENKTDSVSPAQDAATGSPASKSLHREDTKDGTDEPGHKRRRVEDLSHEEPEHPESRGADPDTQNPAGQTQIPSIPVGRPGLPESHRADPDTQNPMGQPLSSVTGM